MLIKPFYLFFNSRIITIKGAEIYGTSACPDNNIKYFLSTPEALSSPISVFCLEQLSSELL